MKLYDLVQTRRGKETVVMTDGLSRVNARMRQLRNSQRKGIGGDTVSYRSREAATESEKFRQKPHDYNPSGGQSGHPRVPRKKK